MLARLQPENWDKICLWAISPLFLKIFDFPKIHFFQNVLQNSIFDTLK